MISQFKLKKLLHYNPRTGIFRWKRAPGFRRDLDGKRAGIIHSDGRVQIMIDYVNYRAHRLAFLYMTGKFPDLEVDHKDGNKTNNRWKNLREASRVVNAQNIRRASSNNKSGLLGAWPKREKFYSQITANGKRIVLGTFETAKQAHRAYISAKRKLHEGCTL